MKIGGKITSQSKVKVTNRNLVKKCHRELRQASSRLNLGTNNARLKE